MGYGLGDLHLPPSVIWLELPPVLLSPNSGKAGRILLRLSKVVPHLGPSSFVRVTCFSSPVFGSLIVVVIGTISSSNQPAFCALSARWYASAAYRSCASREMLKSFPTFSDVCPIGCKQSLASWFSMTAGWKGLAPRPSSELLIDSAPIATPISMLPILIWLAMSCTDFSPEEQKRLTEEPPVVLGKPAASDAARTT